MKTTFIFLTAFLFTSIFAQEHSGSDIADRIPGAYHYKGENSELHVITSFATISGYFKKDGKVDSIRFGSFTKDDISIYLKGMDIMQGKTKSFDEIKLKVTDNDYKKKGTIELKSTNKDKIMNLKVSDQTKYTQESGLAIYMIDDKHFEFAVFWEERENMGDKTKGVYQFYDGVAEKRGVGNVYKYESYPEAENQSLNTSVFFELKDGKVEVWIDTELSSKLGGLEKNERLSFTK